MKLIIMTKQSIQRTRNGVKRAILRSTLVVLACQCVALEVNAARGSASESATDNPLRAIWSQPDFVRRFFGYDASIEPRLTSEEQALYRTLEERRLFTENPGRALEELQSKITPSSSGLLSYSAGTLALQQDDPTNAIRHFEEAVAKYPRFMRAHKSLGLVLTREGEFQRAAPHLTRAIELGGGDAMTHGLLGFCLLELDRNVSAEAAYRVAILLDPDNADWKLGLIKSYVAIGRYDAAVGLLDELIERQPDQDHLWVLQANVFLQLDRPVDAAVNLEILRQLGRATGAHLALLGDIHLMQDARDLALAAYLEALDRDDGQPAERALRAADLLIARGGYTEARQLFAKIRGTHSADLDEEEQMRWLKLEARVAMATGEGDDGIRVLEEIIGRNPMDGEALLLAGDYYARNDQRERAEFRYASAAQIEAYRADAWVKHAQLLVQERKYPEALELLRRAQRLQPSDAVQRYLERVEVAAAQAVRS
jgi:tetratricopeptide (TPR) repeat protein